MAGHACEKVQQDGGGRLRMHQSVQAWELGVKTEAMNAGQRRLFEEALAEDEVSLQAQLEQARGAGIDPACCR